MGKTSIEWTEFSVNPIRARIRGVVDSVGHHCVKVSPGCKNCYASRFQPRRGLPVFQEQRGELEPEVFLDEKVLEAVRRRKKPTTYFWCDMTDMFGEWVPHDWIDKCFATMALTPQHTHQVLTKRAGRMREWFERVEHFGLGADGRARERGAKCFSNVEVPWPLPNVVLMVSAENQEQADKRIPDLLECPAAVHGVSVEPMLGPITLRRYLTAIPTEANAALANALGWVILGGESGPGARPFDLLWGEALLAECLNARVPVFFKQLGARPGCPVHTDIGRGMHVRYNDRAYLIRDRKGGDMAEWPEALRVRQMPALRQMPRDREL